MYKDGDSPLRPQPELSRSLFDDPSIPLLEKVETYLTIAQLMEEEDRVELQGRVFPRLLEWAELRRKQFRAISLPQTACPEPQKEF